MTKRFATLLVSVCASIAGVTLPVSAQNQAPAAGAKPAAAAPAAQPALTKEQTDFFEKKVRPILVANCYECHSVEQHKSKGGLVLDTRDGWLKGGQHGQALVPGDPAKSMLVKAVNYTDDDLQMPPDGKLKDADIATLKEWVKMGAPDPRTGGGSKLTGLTDKARAHWAYQPVKNPPVPTVSDPSWVKTPVDAFVLAKLDANHMKPSAPASKETLIRRATYDLTGLPPTPEEVLTFVNDPSPDAWDKVIDRLLASPHYGERWGRYWLDTARYSDTTGGDDKKTEYRYPFAWTYRDYVIDAFNTDKPYNQFLKEQIAADQLGESKTDPSRLAALGFLTVGKRFQNPNDTIDERIDAVTRGTMALTVACARCHDHKFDPIPQADYYSLHGIFASTQEPTEKPLVDKSATGPEYAEFCKKLAALEQKDRDLYYNLVKEKSEDFRKNAAAYLMVEAYGRKNRDADAVVTRNQIINKYGLDRGIYQTGSQNIRKQQSVFGPMIAFAQLPKESFAADARALLAKVAAGESGRKAVTINPIVRKVFAAVPSDSLKSLDDVAQVYGKLFAAIDAKAGEYLEACRKATTTTITGYDPAMVELFNCPVEIEVAPNLTTERLTEIAPTLPVINKLGYDKLALAEVNELMLTDPGSPPRAMVVEDAPRPRNSPIFIRGDQGNRGQVVPRQFLEILSGPKRKPFTHGSGRAELAAAIIDRKNPLTARVMVNRIWMHHFGQGFVRTPDDLGVQCEAPSHPELLDYLANRFMTTGGWSIKDMHRLIMKSSTYQQSSDTNAAYAQQDPENRLLWRANLRRLDFEAVRDSMLVFSGELDTTVGGKPVNLTDEPYSDRRSVYGYIDRGKVPELLSQFDFADPDMANSRRTSTIVPQQALFFLNSPMAVNVARKVTRLPEFADASNVNDRVRALYSVLYQRPPRAQELQFAKEFLRSAGLKDVDDYHTAAETQQLAKQRERDAKQEQLMVERQKKIAENIKSKGNKRTNSRQAIRNTDGDFVLRRPLTPWEQYAQALLFTNEIVYVN